MLHNSETIYTADVFADFVVVGGGLAGICAAVAAARNGCKTVLIHDRPMLGGNSSSEIRMWICGSHVSEYREGGLLEEMKLANYYYNPTLKYTLWDHVMRDFVENEPNLECYLNTSVRDVICKNGIIESVIAWGINDYTTYTFKGRQFADCSGDSILAASGAEYVQGREDKRTYQEPWGQDESDSQTMGNSVLLQIRKTGSNRPFKAPSWAYHYTDETIPRQNLAQPGDNFWWLEFGGILDTIKDARAINSELTKIALGYWEYIKNHPDGRGNGWSLDWIASLAGKRESRRYIGDYVINQNDTCNNHQFDDAVSYGTWLIDDHHPEAIYTTEGPNRTKNLVPGYHVPFRCLYSKNIANLMFAGRNISASHLAQSSLRVMATCATFGQAIGTAAALTQKYGCTPREVGQKHLDELQQTLMLQDQFIPGFSRRLSPVAQEAIPSDSRLIDGIERNTTDSIDSHSVLLNKGESCSFSFKHPVVLSGARLIWDSDFDDPKRMRCDEGEEIVKQVPASLGKAFKLEGKVNGSWSLLYETFDNFKRLNLLTFSEKNVEELKLTLTEEREPGISARLFSFEPL